MGERIISLLIGYLLGCFLPAEIVMRRVKGGSVFAVGTGNPGMANVMTVCGFRAGIAVLAGDLAKTFLACLSAGFLLFPVQKRLAIAYAGLGAVLGHNYPFWHRMKGGKGVSATCGAIFCLSPIWGLGSMIVGMLVVFVTKYLPIGAVVIPAVFTGISAVLFQPEITVLSALLTIIMLRRHWPGLSNIPTGTEPQIDVIGKIRAATARRRTN